KYDAKAEVYEEHMHSIHGSRNAVMLIRLRHEDALRAVQRAGQEDFHYGDYIAFSKICTHIGCPTSLYEQQTNRILCPCHQSQFDALQYGKPVFGPAARALPELPITVDEEGYLIAEGNFIEPVGTAFGERTSGPLSDKAVARRPLSTSMRARPRLGRYARRATRCDRLAGASGSVSSLPTPAALCSCREFTRPCSSTRPCRRSSRTAAPPL